MNGTVVNVPTKKKGKTQYVLTIVAATIFCGLAFLEPSIRGTALWFFFFWSCFVVWMSVLKLRKLIHGTGWVFPRTNDVLLVAISIEVGFYLWFSR